MKTYRFMIVDVFTDTPLAGNQLGVFSNATGMPEEMMQHLAAELGFSETTFVQPPEGEGDFRLRIFTPTRELPFAGHPTLGTAFAMGGPLQSVLMRIETGVGIVPVVLEREGAKIVYGRMGQPVPVVTSFGPTESELFEVLGMEGSVLPVDAYDNGVVHVYVTLSSFAEVAALKPDFGWLEAFVGPRYVSACAIEEGRVKTRVFAPGLGINEDPATGSAAGPLAAHFARNGATQWGDEIVIAQGAEIGRPSTLYAAAFGSADAIQSIEVGGQAVVVARGEFQV